MTVFQNFLIFIGRVCFSIIFILGGIDKIIQFDGILNSMTTASQSMPEFWLILMVVVQLLAGILIFVGWKTRFGGLLALITILLAQCMFQGFWMYTAAPLTGAQNFMWSNLALLGAGLILIATGPGQISLDNFKNHYNGPQF